MCAWISVSLLEMVPRPKKSGVMKIVVSGFVPAMRKRGIKQPLKTISSELGP